MTTSATTGEARRTGGLKRAILGALLLASTGMPILNGARADDPAWALDGRPPPTREADLPDVEADLPSYRPCAATGQAEGTAPPILVPLIQAWVTAWHALEPGAEILVPPPYLPPQASLNPRLRDFLTGRLDFAFLTREMAGHDLQTYREHHRRDPLVIPVSGGSYRHFGFVDAVAVVVNQANPIRALTLEQLDAIFSRSRLRGGRPVTGWDELGVAQWAGKPVHVVGTGAWHGEESARATFFRQRVMDGAGQAGQWREDAAEPDGGDGIVGEAVAVDPFAIGFTGMGHLGPGIRPIGISAAAGTAPTDPSYEAVASASYPLSRVFYIVVPDEPGSPLPASLASFISFMLSAAGQRIVATDGVFLPLRTRQLAASRAQLGDRASSCQAPEHGRSR